MTGRWLLPVLLACPWSAQANPVFQEVDWVIDAGDALIIRFDDGGRIYDYSEMINLMGERPVRIEGVCQSACTMFLGMPNVCVAPTAALAFHGPVSDNQSIRHLMLLMETMADHLPSAVATRYRADWGLSVDYTWITGAEILAMEPSLKPCE